MLVCLASEKGGVGKTTLAALLAEGLKARGVPLEVADGDRQASLAALAERSEGRLPLARVSCAAAVACVCRQLPGSE